MNTKRALIVTVGTGTRPDVYIVKPLVKTIKDSRPECASIKYITGQRKNGVVINGTEKFLTVSPSAVFALHDIQLAHELILRLRLIFTIF